MDIYLAEKKKGRVYDSDIFFEALAKERGMEGARLERGESGAPKLLIDKAGRREGEAALSISISDTKNFWACAFSEGGPVGLDIEERRSIGEGAPRKLHKNEAELLSALQSGSFEWTCEFLNIWTRKESYLKYIGKGLKGGLSSFSVVAVDLSFKESTCIEGEALGYITGFEKGKIIGALCLAKPADDIKIKFFTCEGRPKKTAFEKCVEILAARDYTKKELERKLSLRGYSEIEISEAVSEAEKLKYIDDERYAMRFAEKERRAGRGNARIRIGLIQRGISAELAEQALCSSSEKSEEERARAAVSLQPSSTEKEIARAARKLERLGYPAHVIYKILDETRTSGR